MRYTYLGLFFTALSALALEILLTRIFSVATWYYFAFFAISVAMFGFTVGALAVYLFKDYFSNERLYERLTLFALLFAAAVDISLVIFLSIPFYPRLTGIGVISTVIAYLAIAAPFICAGVVVCLCLTRFPGKVGLLYGADLVGAAIGAFMVFPLLNAMDAPSAIFLVGAVSAIGAVFFALASGTRRLYSRSAGLLALFTVIMVVNVLYQPVKVEWVKRSYNEPEKVAWNTISRVAVYPFKWVTKPYSWGLSTTFKPKKPIGERMLDMDGVSETVLTLYDGTPESVEHVKYDITSIVHYLRDDAKVFIIGVGGGRDVLAAKLFGQKTVVGVEINDRILEMLNVDYGDFTGHLGTWPGVRLISGEARSVITRMDEKFDIIQASCIATWSATSAGAFSLAENSLYTVEAWKIFLDHLTPTGILSFNRWYSPDYPAQLLRLSSLAAHTLRELGVEDPGRHIAVVRTEFIGYKVGPEEFYLNEFPSATILVSKSPFSESDLERLRSTVEELKFEFVYDPSGQGNEVFKSVIDKAGDEEFHRTTVLDISPPTDDRPFFFHMLRFNDLSIHLKDLFKGERFKYQEQRFNMTGIMMLYILLAVSIAMCVIFIIVPLIVMRARVPLPGKWGLAGLAFFASIGFAYMLVEIGQLQRLIIFLGHPIYSITVVLFSMLFASGLGAVASNRWLRNTRTRTPVFMAMAILLGLLVFTIYMQPPILKAFEASSLNVRIMMSLAFLMPLGFFMGLPFPMGMELAVARSKEHTPWFWAINGATSVVASVLSVCISMALGFTATLKTGLLFYVSATVFLLLLYSMVKREKAA